MSDELDPKYEDPAYIGPCDGCGVDMYGEADEWEQKAVRMAGAEDCDLDSLGLCGDCTMRGIEDGTVAPNFGLYDDDE